MIPFIPALISILLLGMNAQATHDPHAASEVGRSVAQINNVDTIVAGKLKTILESVEIGADSIVYRADEPGSIVHNNALSVPEFAYRLNTIKFRYWASQNGERQESLYSFRLLGYEDFWSDFEPDTWKEYTNLTEGDYRFEVCARDSAGLRVGMSSFDFCILPPWYRTWYAYLGYVIVIFISIRIILAVNSRIHRLEKQQLEIVLSERTEQIRLERDRSDELLLNILPDEAAAELRDKGYVEAKSFESVSVMFVDIKGFTEIAEKMDPSVLVAEIDESFKAYDEVMDRFNVEKIKTIGDAYMAVGGLPTVSKTHAEDVVKAAVEIRDYMIGLAEQKKAENKPFFEVRIGIHSGPVVAGIVGFKKFQYDIWGDTVNTAARMESGAEVGQINISQSTYELVKHHYMCEHRGKIKAKGKGEIDMYTLIGRL